MLDELWKSIRTVAEGVVAGLIVLVIVYIRFALTTVKVKVRERMTVAEGVVAGLIVLAIAYVRFALTTVKAEVRERMTVAEGVVAGLIVLVIVYIRFVLTTVKAKVREGITRAQHRIRSREPRLQAVEHSSRVGLLWLVSMQSVALVLAGFGGGIAITTSSGVELITTSTFVFLGILGLIVGLLVMVRQSLDLPTPSAGDALEPT